MKKQNTLRVRELTKEDIECYVKCWLGSPHEFLTGMGFDIKKKPTKKTTC